MDIKDFLPWVRIIALEIYRSLPASVMLEDLIQDGVVGLILAFRDYREDSGVSFRTYASHRIRWAILDGLRAADWAERSVRGRANRVSRAVDKLQALLGREPSYGEIAKVLGVRLQDIAAILAEAYGHQFVRLEGEGEEGVQDIPDERYEPSLIIERRQVYSTAVAHLKLLDVSERRAFVLRVLCNMSGRQAAQELGVSESRVSQLLKSASEKLAEGVLG